MSGVSLIPAKTVAKAVAEAVIGGVAASRILWALLALLAFFPVLTTMADLPFWEDVAMRIMILGMAAMGLNLILGYGGLVSLGHAAFIGIGAYAVAIGQHHGIDGGWVHLAAGLGAAGGLGLVIGFLSLRTSGLYFIMITLAFAQMLYYLFVSLEAYGGDDGIIADRSVLPLIDTYEPLRLYYLIWIALAGVSLLLMLLVRSRFGAVLAATRSNPERVEAMGLNPLVYRITAFVISAVIGGLAGVLLANWQEYASPAIMHWSRSGELLIIIVIGGMGTLAGPLLGAAGFLLLEEFLPVLIGRVAPAYAGNWMVVFGPMLVLLVLFARGGLMGLADRLSRRLAGFQQAAPEEGEGER